MWLGLGWGDAGVSPFTLFKSYTTAGGLRTPAIIHSSSGRIGSGMKDAIVTVRDISSTILELAGVEKPDGSYDGRTVHRMTGTSLLDYLSGRSETVHGDEPLGWELYGSRALIKGEWKARKDFSTGGFRQIGNSSILRRTRRKRQTLLADFPDVIVEAHCRLGCVCRGKRRRSLRKGHGLRPLLRHALSE